MPSPVLGLREPLLPADATKLVRKIRKQGSVSFSKHCRDKMEEHDLIENDIVNVLRGGRVLEPGELERGSPNAPATWRYRVRTDRICVVVAFRNAENLVVVTTWRERARGAR